MQMSQCECCMYLKRDNYIASSTLIYPVIALIKRKPALACQGFEVYNLTNLDAANIAPKKLRVKQHIIYYGINGRKALCYQI